MSFEGYFQKICEKGHYHTYDAYEDEPEKCLNCDNSWKWTNMVDITNGSWDEDGNKNR